MNKLLLALALTFRLMGEEIQPLIESNTSIEQTSPSNDENFLKKSIIVLSTPVVIAGMIVTTIVLTPVWIVKKTTE